MGLLDPQVPVEHRTFVLNTVPGRHGSATEGTLSDPVTRKIFQVYPVGWLKGDPINVEDPDRTVTDLVMDVPDSTVYHKRDTVTIHGTSFVVQGLPEFDDWGNGLSYRTEYDHLFGGTVLLKRVT